MIRALSMLLLVSLAACASSEEKDAECISALRGVSEAAGTVTLRFISKGCSDPAGCWGTACSWAEGGEPLEVECRLPIGGVGQVDQAPPAGGCDVAAWGDPREPGDHLPVYLALRCSKPGPFLFFTLPDLRALDHDWPLSLPVVSNQDPGGADAPACFNWWDDSVRRCEVGADDPSVLSGNVQLLGRTDVVSGDVPDDFRVSVRVDGHVSRLYGLETTPCTKMLGLDFDLNLIQTAADYDCR